MITAIAARTRTPPMIDLATLAQVAVSCLPARQYMMKLIKVTRIIRLATVILADMTPKTPRRGWCVPPIFLASSKLATRECGVIQTPRHKSKITNIDSIGFRYFISEPGIRCVIPSQK